MIMDKLHINIQAEISYLTFLPPRLNVVSKIAMLMGFPDFVFLKVTVTEHFLGPFSSAFRQFPLSKG